MRKLIGRKVGMTQLFDEQGNVTGVTVIEAGPNYVTQVKTVERDGYSAVQLGFGEVKPKKLTRGELGHLGLLKPDDKHPNRRNLEGVPPLAYLEEVRMAEVPYREGDIIKADLFAVGDRVSVTGTMKGRGFAGNIKRHGFHRQEDPWRFGSRARAWLDRCRDDARPCPQGPAHGRPLWQRAHNRYQPEGDVG